MTHQKNISDPHGIILCAGIGGFHQALEVSVQWFQVREKHLYDALTSKMAEGDQDGEDDRKTRRVLLSQHRELVANRGEEITRVVIMRCTTSGRKRREGGRKGREIEMSREMSECSE